MKYVLVFLILTGVLFLAGPRVRYGPVQLLDTDVDISLEALEKYIEEKETRIKGIKPDNQARIVWANDSLKQKTAYAVVYLHGFSASQEEGAPVHKEFAKRYGCNLYLSRLEDHGRLDSNSFELLTPESYMQSAEDAIDIGKKLGDKVIVMSCSTGSTLAIILAAAGEDIHSMIMYSPNIGVYDPKSSLLLYPWGKQMSELVLGGAYNRINYDTLAQKYWNPVYHTNGIFVLQTLIEEYMRRDYFAKIQMPVFMGYYYKDEAHQDKVVSVQRMLEFFDQITTPEHLKKKVSFPDAGNHVIASHVMSKDMDGVYHATCRWAENVLGLRPVK